MDEDILNFIFELDKKCDDVVNLSLQSNKAFTPSDWDCIIENVINNPMLKFVKYWLFVLGTNDITFHLNTERELYINNSGRGNLILREKMGMVEYNGKIDHLKIEGMFSEIVDRYGNLINTKVYDYDNLPDLYESLEDRLRRLTLQKMYVRG